MIDTIGKIERGLYVIREVLLNEQKPSGVIDSSWLTAFIGLNLTTLNDIPTILYSPLTNKKLRATKTSSNCLKSDEADDDYDISDGDDEPVLTRSCCLKEK